MNDCIIRRQKDDHLDEAVAGLLGSAFKKQQFVNTLLFIVMNIFSSLAKSTRANPKEVEWRGRLYS
jgi:hypothetical protein